MKPGFRLIENALRRAMNPVAAPEFLIRIDPWHKTFARNLLDLVWPHHEPLLELSSTPGDFWIDVFVQRRLPFARFAQSAAFHLAGILLVWGGAQVWPRPHAAPTMAFRTSDVVRYDLSEYLPPLNTGISPTATPQPGDPVYAPQPIISVPPQPDNRRQTIVTPPALKLNRDVRMPNVVAWEQTTPALPVPAVPAVTRIAKVRVPASPAFVVAPPPVVSETNTYRVPVLPNSVIAPTPEVSAAASPRTVAMPQPAIVAPPPGIQMAALRKVSDVNVGPAPVVAPAPQLPVDEQQALPNLSRNSLGNSGASVVPPPPSVQGVDGAHEDGRLIALSLHPEPPTFPVEAPNGNRRGVFAATPNGHTGSTGAPEAFSSHVDKWLSGPRSGESVRGAPSGLFVGTAKAQSSPSSGAGSPENDPRSSDPDPPVVARATAGRALAAEISAAQESDSERQVFGARKSYSMTLNAPNLNSAGGSLVMHFSELQQEQKQGDLFAPVITRAAAPGYPLELMRENVQGTVELSAVIRTDGSVSDVRVLSSSDDRLEQYARTALLRWQFLPALRNGEPVPLQAVVKIPFKARNVRF
ncbi:MAG TPA: TonB family protein [Terriglobales bacterium]|nr:TonB family protein [Terriglobales bacterium]